MLISMFGYTSDKDIRLGDFQKGLERHKNKISASEQLKREQLVLQ